MVKYKIKMDKVLQICGLSLLLSSDQSNPNAQGTLLSNTVLTLLNYYLLCISTSKRMC